jgi:4-carboxymuconolactone decarboxylase
MRSRHVNPMVALTLLSIGALIVYAQKPAPSGIKSGQATEQLPPDIDPITRNRVPPVKLDELDDYGKKIVGNVTGKGRAVVEAGGPSSIRAHSPHVLEYMDMGNYYLRNQAGIEPKLVELTIMVGARAMENPYEWTAHEPAGLKAGLSQQAIDIVKYKKPITGLGEKETAIIQLGREAFYDHKVTSATFAQAQKLFGRQGLVNIVTLMAHYSATAVLLTTFDQHLAAGQASLLPGH